MDVLMYVIVALVVGLAVGAGSVFFMRQRSTGDQVRLAEQSAAEIRSNTEAEKKAILLEAKEEAIRTRAAAETEAREIRTELQSQDRRLRQKEENLDRKLDELEMRQRKVQQHEEETLAHSREVEQLREQQVAAIERVAALTRDEARTLLLQRVEEFSLLPNQYALLRKAGVL